MTFDLLSYWDSISPYLSFIENIAGMTTKDLHRLIPHIKSPVLIVGAGQGLLVEELRRNGFDTEGIDYSLQMVGYAQKRRGIELHHANANDMPFKDNHFMTSIVATGVFDFIEDNEEIKSMINEVKRVTDDHGRIFVVFILYTPQYEELCRYLGIISENDCYCIGISLKWILAPQQALSSLRKDPKKSLVGYIFRAIKAFINNPRLMSAQLKNIGILEKKVKKGELIIPDSIFDTPEQLPYRNKEQIHQLFLSLNIPIRNSSMIGNCNIIRL